jgi:hypothetical protein
MGEQLARVDHLAATDGDHRIKGWVLSWAGGGLDWGG